MKALILAAGQGTRLGDLTNNKPKGMVDFFDKSIIEHQINLYTSLGVNDIAIVRGYKKEEINFPNIRYYDNDNYMNTNMIESLMCAREFFDNDIILSYSDIIFTKQCLSKLLENTNDIAITVDNKWKEYWVLRYGKTTIDIENLKVKNNKITEIGQSIVNSNNIEYRYVGLNKFTKKGTSELKKVYDIRKKDGKRWSSSNKSFLQGYMTDILQEMINMNISINPSYISNNWLEVDTPHDLKIAKELYSTKQSIFYRENE